MTDPLNEQRPNEPLLKVPSKLPPKLLTKSTKENKVAPPRLRSQSKALKPVLSLPCPSPLPDTILLQTNAIKSTFLNEMLSFELSKSPESLRSDFLSRHRITPDIRARMVS